MDNDLATKLAQIEALRPVLGDAAVNAAIAALRGEQGVTAPTATISGTVTGPVVGMNTGDVTTTYTDDHTTQQITASEGSIASHNRQVIQAPNSIYNEAPPDPAAERAEQALRQYLRATLESCSVLPLSALDATDAEQKPLELEHVYIGLHTTTQVQVPQAERQPQAGRRQPEARPLTALEAVQRAAAGRLILRGAPGSGKSTFVSHLALCLAGAALKEREPTTTTPEGGWLGCLPRWQIGTLLPIRVILRDFAASDAVAQAPKGTVELLQQFIRSTLQEAGCTEAWAPLQATLVKGQVLLLLDGLDEVVGNPVLQNVAQSIVKFAQTYPIKLVVTCRILDYEVEPLRQLAGFEVETLADLTDDQMDRFVADWYRELAWSGRRNTRQAADDTRALQHALQTRSELRELGRLPLLLTVMALVHTSKGTLPDARALLYHEFIELLLLRWRQRRGEPDLLVRLNLPQFRANDLLSLMALLGFRAHTLAQRTSNSTGPADLSELTIIELMVEVFARYDHERRYALAQTVLDALTRGNGLLLQRGPGIYAFPHRTFQEYLAGYYLLGQPNYSKQCLERAVQPHWHEALLLMVGYQVLAGKELDKPLSLAEKLLHRTPLEQTLGGEILNVIGRERAATYDPTLLDPDGLWVNARDTLLGVMTHGQAPDAPATLRARAGLAAGTICFGKVESLTKPEVAFPVPDPRLPLAVLGSLAQQAPWWSSALEEYWCSIAPGPFWYGDDTSEELQQVSLPYSYQIGRYPVTNTEYARFLAAQGGQYDLAQPYWAEHSQEGIGERTEPSIWTNPTYNQPMQPVVGVTWYEAVAYCGWLTLEGHHSSGWLPSDCELRLPTSLEWERAARHTDQRRYPWSAPKPTGEHANNAESGIGRPSPVGCFAHGRAACGAQDLTGNVLEWTATPYEEPQALGPQKDFTRSDLIIIRGGSYSTNKEQMCCGVRYRSFASDWYINRGFRVVWSLHSYIRSDS